MRPVHLVEERVYDVATVGERGQIVIPAKARKDFGIKPGDKLMVIRGMDDVGIILIKTKKLSSMLEQIVKTISKIKQVGERS